MMSNYWQTPPEVLKEVRYVLDPQIGLDPCTTEDNPTKARRFFTEDYDGLKRSWGLALGDTIFMNPPYGSGQPILWARKLITQLTLFVDKRPSAITLTKLDNSKACGLLNDHADAMCIPGKRIHFVDPETGKQMKQCNFPVVFHYFGDNPHLFHSHFFSFGSVWLHEHLSGA